MPEPGGIYGAILEGQPIIPEVQPNSFSEAIRRMSSEPLPDSPPDQEGDTKSVGSAELPIELSEFSQRLASFGLGEGPDPLLTETRPPSKRGSH